MIFQNRKPKEVYRPEQQKATVRTTGRPSIQTRNIVLRPSTSQEKRPQPNLQFISVLMNLTAFGKAKKVSAVSITQHNFQSSRTDKKPAGFKSNRVKMMMAANRFPRNATGHRESLYEKSLRRTKSIHERREFQESVKEISAKKYLTAKRSSLAEPVESQRRHKSEVEHPESATIIIQLKRLYNNRVGYNFVHNHYTLPEETKRDEQIFSTTHTNSDPPERPISLTHSLQRARSAKRDSPPRRARPPSNENELIPWHKEADRAEHDHECYEMFSREAIF